jgi:hypothetical protein
VDEGVRKVNLSQRRRIVVVLVVLLLLVVAARLMEGPQERANAPLSSTSLALLLGLSGPIVAAVAIFATDRREAIRLEHERWRRMRDERREAYLAYMAVCDRLHGGDHSPEAKAELRKIVEVVELVSLSKEVQDSVRELTNHLLIRTGKGETETVSRQDESAYRALLGKFKKAIQRDLGITPAAMQDPA